jgi:hypothetical protein
MPFGAQAKQEPEVRADCFEVPDAFSSAQERLLAEPEGSGQYTCLELYLSLLFLFRLLSFFVVLCHLMTSVCQNTVGSDCQCLQSGGFVRLPLCSDEILLSLRCRACSVPLSPALPDGNAWVYERFPLGQTKSVHIWLTMASSGVAAVAACEWCASGVTRHSGYGP